jgi:DNA polymerase III alpha subunit
MKIVSSKSLGLMPVFDLSVNHEHHSFLHSSGVTMHNCAYVIADEPISNFIPLTRVGEDLTTVTQYTAPSVEAVGGLKMDFLVINSLNDIAAAIKLIQQRSGWKPVDTEIGGEKVLAHEIVPYKDGLYSIWKLPEDQAVFRDFCEGKTETVFQFNTPGAVGWLKEHFDHIKQVRPDGTTVKSLDSIEALSAFTALDRPGPLDYFVEDKNGDKHNMLVEFAIRARGGEATGALPILNQLLPETNGVIVYQEQLQKVYQHIGQTTAEQADEFRVHISKKQMSKVIEDKATFMPGAIKTLGVEVANTLWNSMETFGQYGFNKSHSTAYVIISYACAFLKHHFPLEWWTAVLRHADKDEISSKFWQHCGHLIDLPDVSLSGETFEIVNERIRAPLSILHGVGETAHKQLMKYRPYTSLEDFCQKIVQHQISTTVKVPKTVTVRKVVLDALGNETDQFTDVEEVVMKDKKGHNALNKGVIATLIVSGAMDSLFPPDALTVDAMDLFTVAMVKAKGKKSITKADRFDEKYLNLNVFVKYQMRKAVLPAYTEPVTSMIMKANPNGLISNEDTDKRPEFRIGDRRAPFVFFDEIEYIANRKPWPDDYSVTVAAAGYVVEARKFNYGDGKSREAMELIIDVDDGRMKAVKWGGKTGKLPEHIKNPADLLGSVLVVMYTKYNEDRPFVIEDLEVIQPPLTHSAEASPDPSEQ